MLQAVTAPEDAVALARAELLDGPAEVVGAGRSSVVLRVRGSRFAVKLWKVDGVPIPEVGWEGTEPDALPLDHCLDLVRAERDCMDALASAAVCPRLQAVRLDAVATVMDFVPYDLSDAISTSGPAPCPAEHIEQVHLLVQSAAAMLARVHAAGWAHLDVRAEHLLCDDEEDPLLIDWADTATTVTTTSKRSLVAGARELRPPPLLVPSRRTKSVTGTECDVWAFACTALELISATGRLPWTSEYTDTEIVRMQVRTVLHPDADVYLRRLHVLPQYTDLALELRDAVFMVS
jgi:hypothetical protein